ncbi:MAG: hypothetical protein COB85_06020 [Bacteroidetes bacterium]|nr:MAG: hypothetical protein COB85_06020 [Bacteroidota bacterium]
MILKNNYTSVLMKLVQINVRYFILIPFIYAFSVHLTTAQQQSKKIYYIGHSACGLQVPNMIDDLAASAGNINTFDHQLIWGACLSQNWDWHDSTNFIIGSNSWTEIQTGTYDVVAMMDLLPLTEVKNSTNWGCNYRTTEVAGWYNDMAQNSNPNAKTFFIQLWVEFDSNSTTAYQDWKNEIMSEEALYIEVVDSVNLLQSGNDMCIIPVGNALIALTDSIEAGVIPGFTDWTDIFRMAIDSSNIISHLNDFGTYFQSLVYYSTMYGVDPTGVTNMCYDEDNFLYEPVSTATALKMQEIVWNVVSNYPLACTGIPSGMAKIGQDESISIYPNPTNGYLYIKNLPGGSKLEVYNIIGQSVLSFDKDTRYRVDLSSLGSGVFFVAIYNTEGKRVTRKVILTTN